MEVPKVSNLTEIWPYVEPPLFESFWFENFNKAKCRTWMERNWTISLYICAGYLVFIYFGRKFMENRKPFDLRGALAVWNFAFAIFSIIGLSRCTPELWHVLQGPNGFHRSVCVRDYHNQPAAFWAWLFTLSKALELGDTVFVILRKKQLLFVHYYHHSVALITCWCYYSDYEPIFRWSGITNYFTHSLLYGYLFLKTMDIKMPRILSKVIILIELLQMIVGIIVNAYSIWVKVQGQPCEHRTEGIITQMVLYMSFVFLFIYLFKLSSSTRKTDIDSAKSSKKKIA